MLRDLSKRPVKHLEFVAPGAVLLALSLFSIVATLLTKEHLSAAMTDGYLIAGFVGTIVSLLILFRTKVGTFLHPLLLIPYAYFVYYIVGWRGDSWGIVWTSLLLILVIIVNTIRQIRYHSGQHATPSQVLLRD
jgi:hypothetical protein